MESGGYKEGGREVEGGSPPGGLCKHTSVINYEWGLVHPFYSSIKSHVGTARLHLTKLPLNRIRGRLLSLNLNYN